MAETIEKAAINFGNIVVTTERPGRHHTIIQELDKLGMDTPIGGEQGFVTSAGRFVRRTVAARIAINAGQIKEVPLPPNLYSEDLW